MVLSRVFLFGTISSSCHFVEVADLDLDGNLDFVVQRVEGRIDTFLKCLLAMLQEKVAGVHAIGQTEDTQLDLGGDDRDVLQENCRATICDNFSQSVMVRRMASLYTDLADDLPPA